MKNYFIPLAVLTVVVLVSALCIWFIPSLQDFMSGNIQWNGMHTFLQKNDVTVAYLLNDLPSVTTSSTLISIPYINYSLADLAKLKDYVGSGNTLLLADDYGYGNDILKSFGFQTRFYTVELLDPLFCYKNPDFPKVTDFSRDIISPDIKLVVLNQGTALVPGTEMEVVASSSPESYIDMNGNGTLDAGDIKGPFPVAGRLHYGAGTVILISDPGILLNSMLNISDNHAFASELTTLATPTPKIWMDASHLTKTNLDINKARITTLRNNLATPVFTVGIVLLVFILSILYLRRTGGLIG